MRKRKLGWKKKKVKRMTYFVEEVSLWNHVGFLKKKNATIRTTRSNLVFIIARIVVSFDILYDSFGMFQI